MHTDQWAKAMAVTGGVLLAGLATVTGEQGTIGWEPYLYVEWTEEAAFEEVPGTTKSDSVEWKAGLETYWRSTTGQLALDTAYGRKDTDWSGDSLAGESGTASLFNEVETFELSGLWTTHPQQVWGYAVFLGVESQYATESAFAEADLDDALAYDAGAGVSHRFSKAFSLTAGLRFQDNPAGVEDNVFPYLGIFWRINERWSLRTRNGVFFDYTVEGPFLRQFTASVQYLTDVYHLGTSGGVERAYEEEEVAAGISALLEMGDGWEIRPSLSYLFARETTLWRGGSEVLESDREEALRVGLRIGYSF